MPSPVVCLLPARNAAETLAGWFESVEQFADAVVALDDGSTDKTKDLLASHPIVRRLLYNPRRESYAGWDDDANRNRLLTAAAELDPRWIVQLDADELIPTDDAIALRRFLERGADPSFGYLFRVFRVIGDLDHYDPSRLWVGRMFAYEPNVELAQGLHSVRLPTSIGPDRWLPTTIRVKHLAGLTRHERRHRYEKYRVVDPGRRFQKSYEHLLEEPARVRLWLPRPPGLPVVANSAHAEPVRTETGPAVSAIVIAQNDEAIIERTVSSVVHQECPESFEVIVVAGGTDRTAAIVRDRFPDVRIVELERPALPGAARNAGLAVAKGRYVTFPGSHVELCPGAIAGRVRAHGAGWAMVMGVTLNGTRTPAGWASYFLDNTPAMPGRPSGPMRAPPPRCSYLREALIAVGGFPTHTRAGEDTIVNQALFELGYGAYFSNGNVQYHHSPCRTLTRLMTHHFARGRALGRIMLHESRRRTIAAYVLLGLPDRLRATWRQLNRWGPEHRLRFCLLFPLVVAGAVSAWTGACLEIARAIRWTLANYARRGLRDRDGTRDKEAALRELITSRARLYPSSPTRPDALCLPIEGHVTSGFGKRYGRMHFGVDIAAAERAPVRAAQDGVVVFVGSADDYGNAVVMSHGGALTTLYGHLAEPTVREGESVACSQTLGLAGSTGRATGPHVHFEVRDDGIARDPMRYLRC